jgi:hypothetical protein
MPVDVMGKISNRYGSSTHQARIPRLGSVVELRSRMTPSVLVLQKLSGARFLRRFHTIYPPTSTPTRRFVGASIMV